MRRMKTRQAVVFAACVPLLALLSACSTPNENIPTQTVIPLTPTGTATIPPSPVPITATPTPPACLAESGRLEQNVLPAATPPQEFIIYLPPCYSRNLELRYPVIYLLHGQTFKQDQWVRIGAPSIADQLIHSGEFPAFIMVFPDDHYWNAPAGAGFGNRLIKEIIPFIDRNYRTLADREHRALGGLSRGGGWTAQLGFEHPELFGSLGLHSPAIFKDNAPFMEKIIQDMPDELRPRLWFDIGDADMELGSGRLLGEILARNDYIHEFHLFTGDHTELYWSAHVEDYLRWYAEAWQEAAIQQDIIP